MLGLIGNVLNAVIGGGNDDDEEEKDDVIGVRASPLIDESNAVGSNNGDDWIDLSDVPVEGMPYASDENLNLNSPSIQRYLDDGTFSPALSTSNESGDSSRMGEPHEGSSSHSISKHLPSANGLEADKELVEKPFSCNEDTAKMVEKEASQDTDDRPSTESTHTSTARFIDTVHEEQVEDFVPNELGNDMKDLAEGEVVHQNENEAANHAASKETPAKAIDTPSKTRRGTIFSPSSQSTKKRRTRVVTDNSPLFAIKAIRKGSSCDVYIQESHSGVYVLAYEADLKLIRARGKGSVLERTIDAAMVSGEARNVIGPGSKVVNYEPVLQPLGMVPMTSTGKYCTSDAVVNAVSGASPDLLVGENHGLMLRGHCDADGNMTLKECSQCLHRHSNRFLFHLMKIKDKFDGKYFAELSSIERQRLVIELCKAGKILIVQYHRKGTLSVEHVVGLANGYVYCNDAATGGKFNVDEFASAEMDGVFMARVVTPFSERIDEC